MLTLIPVKSPSLVPRQPIGQITLLSNAQFVVPDGVTLLSAVCVGPGGRAGSGENGRRMGGGGGGGALCWANEIPVTPGEVLDIIVGQASQVTAVYNAVSAVVTSISRKGVVLMAATSGRHGRPGSFSNGSGPGGFGGTYTHHASLTNKGGGNGGNGGFGGSWSGPNDASSGGGGGAAGYTGNGGKGGNGGSGTSGYYSWNVGGAPDKDSGGGTGVSMPGSGGGNYIGGGVGLQGRAETGVPLNRSDHGVPGSSPGPYYGAGSSGPGTSAQNGACRLIWGTGRAFPNTKTADIQAA